MSHSRMAADAPDAAAKALAGRSAGVEITLEEHDNI